MCYHYGMTYKTQFQDLAGQKFGSWTVLKRAPTRFGRTQWFCHCDCGTERDVSAVHLKSGASVGCGCTRPRGAAHPMFKHGSTGIYSAWLNIIQRCENPNNKAYRNYGGRGIKLAPEWRNDFIKFREAMGPKPGPEYTVERIENHRGYEPGNVRWATRIEQGRNTRRNHLVTIGGKTMPLSAAAELTGINYGTAKWRLLQGQSDEEALDATLRR